MAPTVSVSIKGSCATDNLSGDGIGSTTHWRWG